MKRKNELYIPTKILDSDDYIQGFANRELAVIGIISVIAVVIGICIYQITENMFLTVMFVTGGIGISLFLIRRDMCNEDVFQKLKILWRNARMQKRYPYQYWNIYEDVWYEDNE